VQLGLDSDVAQTSFLQCEAQNLSNRGMRIRLLEGFASAWKVRNFAQYILNGTASSSGYTYNQSTSDHTPIDGAQNVPGAIYNAEAGFENIAGTGATPTTSVSNSAAIQLFASNPPRGTGVAVTNWSGYSFWTNNTNIQAAGIATQGTRFVINVSSMPAGATLWFPTVVALRNKVNNAGLSGVMVMTNASTSGNPIGAGAFSRTTGTSGYAQPTNGIVTYEVLYTEPGAEEYADILPAVSYTLANLGSNLPEVGVTALASASFGPYYDPKASADFPQDDTYTTPRFIRTGTPKALYTIVKCACNLLFPWVSSAGGYDTGIVVSNTSKDPGATAGFSARAQQGRVTFWYYGTTGINGPASTPASQTSSNVPAGNYVTHILSQNLTSTNNLNSVLNFAGYVIAQAEFQYCHGVAFVFNPSGTASLGYLGLQIDTPCNSGVTASCLPRTNVPSESVKH
jgi:hypothetical protein